MPRKGYNYSVHASDEMRAAAAAYRARDYQGDAELADLLEETARKAADRVSVWQLAEYSAEEQMQLAECWWRNELAIARALHPDAKRDLRSTSGSRAVAGQTDRSRN
jgi:non-ribosomal peptide synthetase component E (peptide arylation enzyme)